MEKDSFHCSAGHAICQRDIRCRWAPMKPAPPKMMQVVIQDFLCWQSVDSEKFDMRLTPHGSPRAYGPRNDEKAGVAMTFSPSLRARRGRGNPRFSCRASTLGRWIADPGRGSGLTAGLRLHAPDTTGRFRGCPSQDRYAPASPGRAAARHPAACVVCRRVCSGRARFRP